MSSGYDNYQDYDAGGSNSHYYDNYGQYTQDAYEAYAPYQGGSGYRQAGSYDYRYVNQAPGMNPFYSNPMQTQWQMMQHFYSTDAYSGGGGSGNNNYRTGGQYDGQR